MIELIGPRVRLRPFRVSELDMLEHWFDDRERMIGSYQPYDSSIGKHVRAAVADHLEPQVSAGMFAIEIMETGSVIGQVRYSLHVLIRGQVEYYDIGYSIANLEQRRQGYARESCTLLINHLFERFPIERIGAFVYKGNIPSRRLLESLKFAYEGTIRKAAYFDEQWFDLTFYGLLREDWGD